MLTSSLTSNPHKINSSIELPNLVKIKLVEFIYSSPEQVAAVSIYQQILIQCT